MTRKEQREHAAHNYSLHLPKDYVKENDYIAGAEWADDDYMWCEPDGNINHCISNTYPLGKWFKVEHLSTDYTEPKVIIEDHYSE